jgi:hypothetical protein
MSSNTGTLEQVGRIVHEARRAFRMNARGHTGGLPAWDESSAPVKYDAIKLAEDLLGGVPVADSGAPEQVFLLELTAVALRHFGLTAVAEVTEPLAPAHVEAPKRGGRHR